MAESAKAASASNSSSNASNSSSASSLNDRPKLKAVKAIKQTWLEEFRQLQDEEEALSKRLASVKAQREEKSEILCAYWNAGIRPEKGRFTGLVRMRKGQRRVTKEQLIERFGAPVYADLLSNAKKGDDKEYFDVLLRV